MIVNRLFGGRSWNVRQFAAALACAGALMAQGAWAQSAAPADNPAAAPVISQPAPAASPPVASPAPAPTAPVVSPKTEITPLPDQPPVIDSSSVPFDLPARPVAVLRGKASWDDSYKVIHDAFKKIADALAVEKIAVTGKPLAVFVETNDQDFKYEIMLPIEKAPEGKTSLPGDISFGMSPAGKVLKFQHRGAYDDVDSTYEAITAYLDERGFESRDLFVEEYLNEVKGPDDVNLQVDVYVYLK